MWCGVACGLWLCALQGGGYACVVCRVYGVCVCNVAVSITNCAICDLLELSHCGHKATLRLRLFPAPVLRGGARSALHSTNPKGTGRQETDKLVLHVCCNALLQTRIHTRTHICNFDDKI